MDDSTVTDAVAAYVKNGGTIRKLPETVTVTAPDVVNYLLSCGLETRYYQNNSTTVYVCKGRVVTLRKLVEWANNHRLARQLRPFALKL